MKKIIVIVLDILLVISAIIFTELGIKAYKYTPEEQIVARDKHLFNCTYKTDNTERNLSTVYTYQIKTDKDYLVSDVTYTESIYYDDADEYTSAKKFYEANTNNKEVKYNDANHNINLISKLDIEGNEKYPAPPFELYKNTSIPAECECKEVLE
jgi:hypothetical protein